MSACVKMFWAMGAKSYVSLLWPELHTHLWICSLLLRGTWCMCFNWYIHNCLQKDALLVKVNKLTSTKTQLPYSYYSLPFCKPDTIVDSAENLGEVLRGDRIENSPYVVSTSLLLVMYSPYQLWCTKSLSVVYSVVWAVVWDEGAQDVPDCLQSINWW